MKFLKADVNLHLLALVLAVLVVFVSFNAYYQNKIRNLQSEYDKQVENLKAIEGKLLSKEKKLNEISELKDVIKNDKEVLEIGYLSLKSENQDLKQEPVDEKPFGKAMCKTTGNVVCLG